jgi:PAS domain S-box-containing protein
MAQEADEGSVKRLRFESGPEATPSAVAAHLAESISHELGCDEVSVTIIHQGRSFRGAYPPEGSQRGSGEAPIFSVANGQASFGERSWTLPIVINDLQRARVPGDLALELAVRKVRSGGIFPVSTGAGLSGVIECFFTRSYHRWRQEELDAFSEVAASLHFSGPTPVAVNPQASSIASSMAQDDLRSQYRRMARYGNIVILMTDGEFRISDVFGNTELLLGIPASQMLSNAGIWDLILHPKDRDRLRRRIVRLRVERDELKEEVRVIHQRTGETRWMMLRAVPHFSAKGAFLGWEGFGIDITERRQAQEDLVLQNRRLEALFEVSRSLRGQVDPAVIALKGLRAVLSASGSDCGYSVLVPSDEGRELEVVAAQGLSETYLTGMHGVLTGPSLLWHAVDTGQAIMIEDLQTDARANTELARREGLHSAIVAPLTADERVLGALVMFKRTVSAFSAPDLELAQAAAAQISLAVKQADMFESERRHSESLSALYRLSHELGKYRSIREIAENAFPLLEQEFGLKRGWLGVMNEQGTHVMGQTGFGPGVKKKLQQVQIELALRHDFFDDAIRTQRPLMVQGNQEMECSGLNSIMQHLRCGLVVIIPLVSLGQVVGVLVGEPRNGEQFVREGRLQLLVSMANEMATVFMARRFEDRMSESFKMRMAGLLASGVAHNFNNLLQAILGQVSLIELQSSGNGPILESSRLITDAAKRGASLVSQLLNFSAQAQPSKQNVSLTQLIEGSMQLYESLLSRRNKLIVRQCPDCPEVVVDSSQIQQVVTALLANAKEAMSPDVQGVVTLSTTKVRLRTGEVHPELAPGVYIRLDVADNGVGMTHEQQLRCFEPFYTTKNVDRATGVGLTGNGLGLSAAYSIIKQHEGMITVQSVPGSGTTFSVYLPVLSVKTGTALEGDLVRTSTKKAGGAILVGMEPGVQPYFTSIFESLGHRSRTAFDGQQVKEIMKREPGTWEFVVIDLDTIGDTALSLIEQLLRASSELCLIGIAASAREWAERLPMSTRLEVVDKPVGVWTIESALQRLRVRPDDRGNGLTEEAEPQAQSNGVPQGAFSSDT